MRRGKILEQWQGFWPAMFSDYCGTLSSLRVATPYNFRRSSLDTKFHRILLAKSSIYLLRFLIT